MTAYIAGVVPVDSFGYVSELGVYRYTSVVNDIAVTIEGYSKTQAASIIGCSTEKYINQLISKGHVIVVGRMPVAKDSNIYRLLVSVKSVNAYAKVFDPREEDGARAYETRLTPEQLAKAKEMFPGVGFKDLTAYRTAQQRKYHERKKNARQNGK